MENICVEIVETRTNAYVGDNIYHVKGKRKEKNSAVKKQFVEEALSATIAEACSWVNHLEFDEEAEAVAIVCQNGYKYHVNIACDSLAAIVKDVISEVLRH